jgi:hypothetical protein
MTYAVLAYVLAAVIWIGYLLSLRSRMSRVSERGGMARR